MPNTKEIHEQAHNDLYVTHVLINALRAAYQGLYIYFTAASRLSRVDMTPELEETSRQLDLIHRWWADFKDKKALSGVSDLPALTGDCRTAWEMLQAIQLRYSQMNDVLSSKAHLDGLFSDAEALHLRVAVHCEHAYARQHYIEGLAAYGKIMGDDETEYVYLRHAASCQEEVRRVNECLAEVLEMGDTFQQNIIREIFDETLTLPGMLSQKIADLREIFGRYQGGFHFQHTGIPPNQIADWEYYGFTPTVACQWYLAGFEPALAYAWGLVGLTNPIEALQYQLRQFDINTAMPWWSNCINGRTAAAWQREGYTPEQAMEYRKNGIGHPSLIEQVHS